MMAEAKKPAAKKPAAKKPVAKKTPVEQIQAVIAEVSKNSHNHNVHVAVKALQKAEKYLLK